MDARDARVRYLRDRVLTATPAQRVVMLYDRLALDLTVAQAGADSGGADSLGHAMQIVTELQTSLNITAGGPAENLAAIYSYLLGELIAARGGDTDRLAGAARIVTDLRESWAEAAQRAGTPHAAQPVPVAAGAGWAAVG